MKKKLRLLSFYVGIIILGLLLSTSSMAQDYKDGILQGTFRVKLKPYLEHSVSLKNSYSGATAVATGITDVDQLNVNYSVANMKRIFPYSPKHEAKHQKYGLHLWYEVTISDVNKTMKAIQSYSALQSIDICEPIREVSLIHPMSSRVMDKSEVLKSAQATPFNDPYLPMQWHYNNTGQTGGMVGADINLYKAWEVTAGSSNVIVSIHDEGVDVKHEDLKDAMWVNEAELNGEPDVDDDGNGYKDDIYGFNFGDNIGDISAGHHGSHVAGTVGATNNNGVGVAGVAGGTGNNDGTRIMSCQILGGVTQGNLPSSFVYAADNGAVISQNSWGYNQPGYIEQAILDAIDYFIKEAGSYAGSPMKGGVVIFAAGNDNYEGHFYPGYYEEVIAVSALGSSNEKASYTNYGSWVDVAAPGGDSGDDANMTDSQTQAGYSNSVLSCYAGNSYGFMDGTSMACPHVSGIAALVVAKFGHENFKNTTLKKHLITAVHDIYQIEANRSYKNKLGSGAIDASLALKQNNGLAPEVITDLAMTGLAQDFAMLEWSVPADSDDELPWEFDVLYSKEEINIATLEYARRLVIKNDSALGKKVTIEVSGLEALTDYHFAVRSIDRWGNVSDFSNRLTATTNAGPDAQIDPTTKDLLFTIDASASSTAVQSFNILNIGEGLLRWNTANHHVSSIDAYSVANIRYPEIRTQGMTKQADIQTYSAGRDMPISTYGQSASTDYMRYYNMWQSMYYIGEEDTSYTNSAAMRFFSSKEEGFNMTHLESLLRHDATKGPVVLEIREGADIVDSKLIYAQEIEKASEYGFTNIQLDEQLFFPYGTHFWVVVHVPSGNRYPIGAGMELQPELSEMCYMSLNGGKSWARFEDMYYNNLLVWAFTPISKLKPEQTYLRLSPSAGETPSQQSSTVDVNVDMSQLVNGTYRSNIVVYTNETDSSMLRVPSHINLKGHPFNLVSESIIDCGSVILGNAKVISVNIENTGLGNFKYANITIDNPDFKVKSPSLGTIGAKSGVQFNVVFEPSVAGNANAVARISNYLGDEFIFNLFGVAAEPPVMEMSPATLVYDNLTIGDVVNGEFTITNTGKYPLEYFFPGFVETDQTVDVDEKVHLFGYSAQINEGGLLTNPPYEWSDISGTGTQIVDYDRSRDFFYHPVELDFDFPFFGKRENSLFITNWGMVTFDQNSTFNVLPPNYKLPDCPDRFMSAIGKMYDLSEGGAIYYQSFGDKFVVQYDKVVWNSFDWWSGEIYRHEQTFQIVIYDNGDIEYIYNTLGGIDAGTLSRSFIAIEDQMQKDGYFITDIDSPELTVSDQTVIRFVNPGLGLVTELTNPQGKIQVGESVTIGFTASTEVLNVERHQEKLAILSNDPQNNPGVFTIDMNITGGGVPNVEVSQTAIDFGKVFQGADVKLPVWAVNNGRSTTSITSVETGTADYTATGTAPADLTPGRKLPYLVTLNTTQLGVFTDVVTLTTAEGKEITIAVTGEVIEAPVLDVSITSVDETVVAGEKTNIPFTIANSGGNNLDVAIIGTDWLTVDKKIAPMSHVIKDFTYHVLSSDNENGPAYNWVDIMETGVRIPNEVIYNEYWVSSVDLPFEFNFYGQPQTEVHIGNNGILCFNEYTENFFFGGDLIPNVNIPNNFIAGMWGLTGPNMEFYEDAGIYYQVMEDKLIVQCQKFVDGFGMSDATSFQIILYANGNIKMQFEWGDAWVTHMQNYSQTGLENADGTDGVIYSAYEDSRIHDDLAVLYTPVEKHVIVPGASLDLVATVNAAELFAGTYSSNIRLLNNAPGKGYLDIPVALNVTGEALLTAPTGVDFGSPMVIEQLDAQWYEPPFKAYELEFEIKNEGTKRFEVLGFDLTNVTKMSKENSTFDKIQAYTLASSGWGEPMLQWVDIVYLPQYDWMTGPVPIYVEPKSSLKLKANYMPDGALNAAGDALLPLTDILVINTDLAEMPEIEVSFTATPVLPPVMSTDKNLLSVYAQDETTEETHKVVLDNSQGHSDLTYTIKMDYERNAQAASVSVTDAGVLALTDSPALMQTAHEGSVSTFAAASSPAYNRVLQYHDAAEPESKLGLGGTYQFSVGTRYHAPESGFNLTHVQTWYTPEDWLDSKITVEVLAGSPFISQCEVLYTEDFKHIISEADHIGSMLTFELTQTQMFYPNEPFFVVFKYPTAVKYPQGIVEIGETVDGRFTYNAADVWYDLGGTDFATKGWMTTAVEAEYKTGLWVELQSEMQGVVKAGEVLDLDFAFNAAFADIGDNYAVATVTSNDPFNGTDKVDLHLLRNRAPEIIFNTGDVSVIENETETIDVTAIDHEQDSFTLEINNAPAFITSERTENRLSVTFAPGYEDAGMYSFDIVSTDIFNNSITKTVVVNVVNNNRFPAMSANLEDQIIVLENGALDLDLNDYFSDDDGESLIFGVLNTDESIVDVFLSGSRLMLDPVMTGTTQLSITVNDVHGAFVNHNIDVTVMNRTGVNEMEKENWTIYPNPAQSFITIVWTDQVASEVEVRIFNAVGTLLIQETVNTIQNSQHTLQVEQLREGVYILEVNDGAQKIEQKIVIQ